MNPLRCAILEDQRPAQRVLTTYVADADGMELVGVFKAASEAARGFAGSRVDLLFLDLHLPKMDGFSFLRTLPQPPLVIVTTADAEQALEGYSHNVVDYLLKPFSFERFLQAVEKARQRRYFEPSAGRSHREDARGRDLFIRANGEIRRIPVDLIEFIRAESDYVELFTTTDKFFFARTLQSLHDELGSDGFARVHRSYIVNMRHISRIVGTEIHIGGTTVPIGRSYRERFLKQISLS
ncbi:MAG: LytTR family DNA-binding domain-containing protein [Erythrobacter sp.]|uniref:LytR/AlgR family response regulator transcription factor n=1 Tax=Erythrobacter sp. TaxID=1042 RepID=UPI0026346C00|nr:LytTR family DNA-binding domain-containing protein [Erythrobacter sp.]MDJ0979173.1 LytTR family DNA-binding domain-containing protein [Erythrobacter sp.]